MDPFSLIGALAGAGGGIASALLGAESADQAAAWNYAINEMNIRAQQKQQRTAVEYADKIRGEQNLGGTDALGNRTHFVKDKGWQVDLSPEQQALYDYFFNQELPERQGQYQRQAEDSRQFADQGNALLNEMRRVRKDTPMDAANKLYAAATRGASEGERNVTETAMRQAARTGNSNIAQIMAALGKASMESRGAARQNAELQAEDYVNEKFGSERGNIMQLLQMFTGMSNQPLNPSYDPSGIPQGANQLMNLFSQQSSQGNSMGFNARMQPAPQRVNIEPNNAWANAAGAIGSSLSGLGTRVGGMNQQNNANNQLMQYMTGGGQLNMGGGGIFGSMTDRLRKSEGM